MTGKPVSVGERCRDCGSLRAAVPALIKALLDANVRASADAALTSIGKAAVPALIKCLDDQEARVVVHFG